MSGIGWVRAIVERRERLGERVRRVLVERVGAGGVAAGIDPDVPLFAVGLGLDSIEAIELLVGIEDEFGVELPGGEESMTMARSVNGIVDHLIARSVA